MRLFIVLLLAITAVGCGGYSSSMSGGSGAPHIATLSPNNGANNTAVTVTINGTGFTSGSVVWWGMTTVAATNTGYLSTTQLQVNIPASLVPNPGTVGVYVRTSAGTSNTVNFTVN